MWDNTSHRQARTSTETQNSPPLREVGRILEISEGHCKIVVVSSSMLRQWMVAWSMRKFTYAIAQDSVHRRYEHHISTTTNILIFLNIFVGTKWRIFVLKTIPLSIIYCFFQKSARFICIFALFVVTLQRQFKWKRLRHSTLMRSTLCIWAPNACFSTLSELVCLCVS